MRKNPVDDDSEELITRWFSNLTIVGLEDGRPDAAEITVRALIERIKTDELTPEAHELLVEILQNILYAGESLKFLNPAAAKTRNTRSFRKSIHVVFCVSTLRSKGHPLRSNTTEVGAMELAAKHFNTSVSTINRLWREGQDLMGRAWVRALQAKTGSK